MTGAPLPDNLRVERRLGRYLEPGDMGIPGIQLDTRPATVQPSGVENRIAIPTPTATPASVIPSHMAG